MKKKINLSREDNKVSMITTTQPAETKVSPFQPGVILSSSRVSSQTVGRAVDALLKWIKSKTKYQKAQLLDHDELIYLILSLKKIPQTSRTNPFKIPLPHPLHALDGSEQFCLIIDDRPRTHNALNSEMAKKKIQSESIPISKVIKLSKLKTDYRPFEAKRKLCGSYDIFFADKRVLPLLPRLLGKHFFKTKKIPIAIDLTHKDWKSQIEHACGSALLYLRSGTCSILKVGRVSQERDEIVANVAVAIEGVAEIVPKKWSNIRSFHLKSLESVALPMYQSAPEIGLKIEVREEQKKKEEVVEVIDGPSTPKEAEKKKKSSAKKGRIHEVRYMDGDINQLMADLAGEDNVEGVKEIDAFNSANEVTVKEKKKNKKGRALGDGVKEIDEFNAADEVTVKEKKNKKGRGLGDGVKNIDEPNTADEVSVKEKKKNKKGRALGDGVKVIDEFNAADEVTVKVNKKNKKGRGLGDGVKNIDEPNTANEVSVKEEKKNKKDQIGGVVNGAPVKKPRRMKEKVPLELKQDSPTKRKRGEETVSFLTKKTKKKSTVEEPNQQEEKLKKKSAAEDSVGRVGRLKKKST